VWDDVRTFFLEDKKGERLTMKMTKVIQNSQASEVSPLGGLTDDPAEVQSR
jgi:hypothetical protein